MEWDVFISHASEDKEAFVRALAKGLSERGLRVWFDEFTLTVGDSLRRSIDRGLALSRFGIVIVSESFLAKEWPQKELDGLEAREVDGIKVILPVWHNIGATQIRARSPLLADRLATLSANGLDRVIDDLLRAIQREPSAPAISVEPPAGRQVRVARPARPARDSKRLQGETASFKETEPKIGAAPGGLERKARVKWYNGEKGFGFVELTDGSGEAFLHHNEVVAAGHKGMLESGTMLTVRVDQGRKGLEITEITAIDTSTAERRRSERDLDNRLAHIFPKPNGPQVDGQVKWYDPKKGFGFVAVEGSKDVFIHRSILARAGVTELHEGERIHMCVDQSGNRGLEATWMEFKDD